MNKVLISCLNKFYFQNAAYPQINIKIINNLYNVNSFVKMLPPKDTRKKQNSRIFNAKIKKSVRKIKK